MQLSPYPRHGRYLLGPQPRCFALQLDTGRQFKVFDKHKQFTNGLQSGREFPPWIVTICTGLECCFICVCGGGGEVCGCRGGWQITKHHLDP